jgi:septum formation protein
MTLRSAGIEPIVVVSGVDEDAVLAAARAAGHAQTPKDDVLILARAKAQDVSSRVASGVVLGCDSMLEIDGEVVGKPGDAATAAARWRAMRGRSGVLHTGHWLVDHRSTSPEEIGATASTVVNFADLSDAEIDSYVATGEPLLVAGAFTIDGLGGPFIEGIEGDHHNVVGLSLPLLRRLLGSRGISIQQLWART